MRIRQNLSGSRICVELSNQYDSVPLQIASIQVSLSSDLKNPICLTSNNKQKFEIPANQKLWTDTTELEISQDDTLYFELKVQNKKNKLATSANLFSQEIVHTNIESDSTFIYGVTSVAIETTEQQPISIGFFGDSLVNQAYFSDHTLQTLYQTDLNITGFNAGISGNRLLLPGTADSQWRDSFGIAGVARFREDIVGYRPDIVLGLIGINDLFHPGTGSSISELPSPEQLIEGYQKLYNEAAASNIDYVALTLPPFANSFNHEKPAWSKEKEDIRLKVNTWLLTQPYTIDIAKFVADPKNFQVLDKSFDCGDHLHFSANGGKKIGDLLTKKIFPLVNQKKDNKTIT